MRPAIFPHYHIHISWPRWIWNVPYNNSGHRARDAANRGMLSVCAPRNCSNCNLFIYPPDLLPRGAKYVIVWYVFYSYYFLFVCFASLYYACIWSFVWWYMLLCWNIDCKMQFFYCLIDSRRINAVYLRITYSIKEYWTFCYFLARLMFALEDIITCYAVTCESLFFISRF
jgi:hypothetical protein